MFSVFERFFCDSKAVFPCDSHNNPPVQVNLYDDGAINVAATEKDIKNPKANVKNAGFTPEEREKFQCVLNSGFIDTYRYFYPEKIEYSWWSYRFKARERNAGWRIDYFCVSESLKEKLMDAKIHTEIMGSDHCPVELDIRETDA